MSIKKRSAAFRLMELVYDFSCADTGHSWDRINHAMRSSLHTAIQGGLRFNRVDFAMLAERLGSGYWLRNDGGNMVGEWFYREALIYGNSSAAQSFEAWKRRPPFIVDRIEGSDCAYSNGHFHVPKTGRLAMGFRFHWAGLVVTVTSFSDDGQSLTACAYKNRPIGKYGYEGALKISRRFKITIEALRAEMTHRRKASKAGGVI